MRWLWLSAALLPAQPPEYKGGPGAQYPMVRKACRLAGSKSKTLERVKRLDNVEHIKISSDLLVLALRRAYLEHPNVFQFVISRDVQHHTNSRTC